MCVRQLFEFSKMLRSREKFMHLVEMVQICFGDSHSSCHIWQQGQELYAVITYSTTGFPQNEHFVLTEVGSRCMTQGGATASVAQPYLYQLRQGLQY